jgi:hypothetical protein
VGVPSGIEPDPSRYVSPEQRRAHAWSKRCDVQDPQKMAQLGEAEVTADDAMRRVQREIRQLDEEIGKIGGAS